MRESTRWYRWVLVMVSAVVAVGVAGLAARPSGRGAASYDDLVRLFQEWRQFQRPPLVDGVPNYRSAAMQRQYERLADWRERLDGLNPSTWPIPQAVDWRIVRAEMDGLDFDHRVLRPWANNPAFYVTVFPDQSDQPAREGPLAFGAVELWSYRFPLSSGDATKIAEGLRPIPRLLAQAKENLVGDGHDLWLYGAKALRQQAADLKDLAGKAGEHAALKAEAEKARAATEDLASWVEARVESKRGPSGVGRENYDWYLKHVQLVPYTWQDEVLMLERELGRARSFLALEEQRNRALPPQVPIASAEEFDRRFASAITEYMDFLRRSDVLTVVDGMDHSLRERVGHFQPGPREFFSEVDYRDPLVMRTHGFHWFDLLRVARKPHASPIRRGPLLYNIFDSRTEGLATGWEEMMLQAGMFDARPRARELVYILVAQRAARGLGDLRMHANVQTLEQAAAFASANTPRGWLRLDGNMVRGEQHLYLQQPGYGTSYLIGKMQIEQLMAERRRQMGDAFTIRRFMDELQDCGLIPMSLIRWELTGEKPE